MNTSMFNNISTFTDYATIPNTLTQGWFWIVILLTFFFVLYISFSRTNSVKVSAIVSLFICTMTALMLSFAGLLNFSIFITLQLIFGASVIVYNEYLK